ncbi:MAG: hypothetical protein PHW04_06435 [Candidatus Wallbacteria bacterium]|nr:hypothetical protein [Candidatus Wallbacteria bacterium]
MRKVILIVSCVLMLPILEAATGVVDLGMAFNCHPLVLLYYYPQYQAFLRPLTVKLSEASILTAQKDLKEAKAKAEAENQAKIAELTKKKEALDAAKQGLQCKMDMAKNNYSQEQARVCYGKSPEEIMKINVTGSQQLERTLSPLQAQVDSIDQEIAGLQKEEKALKNRTFYLEFTTPEETSKLLARVRADVREAVKKVADAKGIDLVINSAVYKKAKNNAVAGRDYAAPSFDRILAMSGIFSKEMLSRNDLKSFTGIYVQRLENEGGPPPGEGYFQGFLAGETTDLTADVAAALLNGSEIHSKVQESIITNLREGLK